MDRAAGAVLEKAQLAPDDVAWFGPIRQMYGSSSRAALLRFLERFFVNVDRYGNTSAASIAIPSMNQEERRAPPRSNVVTVGFGVGLTWQLCPPLVGTGETHG